MSALVPFRHVAKVCCKLLDCCMQRSARPFAARSANPLATCLQCLSTSRHTRLCPTAHQVINSNFIQSTSKHLKFLVLYMHVNSEAFKPGKLCAIYKSIASPDIYL